MEDGPGDLGAAARGGLPRLPSRDTARLLHKAQQLGPQTAAFAHALFVRLGRSGQRALYGLTNLARHYPRAAIEAVCARLLAAECFSYAAVKRALERTAAGEPATARPALTQSGPAIRAITEYQAFWETHAHRQEDPHAHVDART